MKQPIQVLYVDDYPLDRELVRDVLTKEHKDFVLIEAASRDDFEKALNVGGFDLVLSDFNILGFEGLQVLSAVHAKDLGIPVIIVTGTGSEEIAVEAMKCGAADYVIKKFNHIQRLPLTIRAVLDKKRLEQEQRESELRYRQIFENSGEAILLTNPDGTIYSANPEACRIFQLTESEIRNLGRLGLVDINDPRLPNALEERRITGKFKGELNCIRRDGTIFSADISSTLFVDSFGIQRTSTIIRDITERKKSEEALKQTASQLRKAQEIAKLGFWTFKLTGEMTWSDDMYRMFGVNQESFILNRESFLNLFHPDDHNSLKKWINECRAGEKVGEIETRIILPNGKIRHIISRGELILDPEGTPLQITGTALDISESRQAEVAVRESQLQLAGIFNTTMDAIITIDEEQKIVDFNPAAENLFLCTASDAVGKSLERFIPESTRAKHNKFIRDFKKSNITNRTMKTPVLALTCLRSNGEVFPSEVSISQLSLGEKILFTAIIRDITARKLSEEKIRRQFDYLTGLRTIDQTIISTFDLKLSLNTLLSKTISLMSVDAAAVLLYNSASLVLEYAASLGFITRAVETAKIKLGEGHAGKAALERRIIQISDLAQFPDDPLLSIGLSGESFTSYYGVPLIAKGKVIGVLELFHRSVVERDDEWFDFLNTLAGQAALAIDNSQLFESLQHSNIELSQAYDATIEGWSRALDLRDKETEGHTLRVTDKTLELARLMGLKDMQLIQVQRGSLLHDIGKMGVPDGILLKPGPLTDEEWMIMKKHPTLAFEMLSPINYLSAALDIPYCHHEKWDGTGYPRGLRGEQIPIAARIFAVIDVYDALTSDRPYRAAWAKEKTLTHIKSLSGVQFDPKIIDAFLKMME